MREAREVQTEYPMSTTIRNQPGPRKPKGKKAGRREFEDVIGTAYRIGKLFKPDRPGKQKKDIPWYAKITRYNAYTDRWEPVRPYKKSSGSTKKDDARRKLWEWCIERDRKEKNEIVAVPFEHAADEWLDEFVAQVEVEGTRKATTLTNYLSVVGLLKRVQLERRGKTLGELNLCDLTVADVTDLKRSDPYLFVSKRKGEQEKRKRHDSSKQQILRCLKTILRWAATKENGRYLARVPAFDVLVGGKQKRKAGIRLEPWDVQALLISVQYKAEQDPALRNLWLLLVLLFKTCYRRTCCLRLRWTRNEEDAWVDLSGGWIVTPAKFTKRGEAFDFPMDDELWELLKLVHENREGKDDFVLEGLRTRRETPRSWYGITRKCLEVKHEGKVTFGRDRNGNPFRFHHARSVYVTWLDEAGFTEEVVDEKGEVKIVEKGIPETYKRFLADHSPGSDEHVGYRTPDYEEKARSYINALPRIVNIFPLPDWLGGEYLRVPK